MESIEIRVYDSSLMRKGTVDNITSLQWNRRYFEAGSFELHVPLTPEHVALLVEENIVSYPGATEAGVIESVEYIDEVDSSDLIVKGRFLESYLDRRLIRNTYNFNGKTEVAMRDILGIITPIPLLTLGTLKGYTQTIQFQATMKNAMTIEEKLASSAGLGWRCRPDFVNKKIVFEVYQGLDHSTGQTTNNRVTFSDEYENLNNVDYLYNSQIYKTVAVVGGEGEGSDRIYVEVGSGEGLNLREIFVDAKDIQKGDLTDTQYKEALKQKGQESLMKNALSVSFTAETLPYINYTYKVDYDLGDIVTIAKSDWNIKSYQRITEIQEIYENEQVRIVPTFGSPLAESIKWED